MTHYAMNCYAMTRAARACASMSMRAGMPELPKPAIDSTWAGAWGKK